MYEFSRDTYIQSIYVCLKKILNTVIWVSKVIQFKIIVYGKKWYTKITYFLTEMWFIRERVTKDMKIKCEELLLTEE